MKAICSFNRPDFPPELHLILACLRLTPNEQEAQRIEQLSQTAIAWPVFLRWVDRHRVAPLVYVNLSRYAAKTVPSSILSELRFRFEKNALRALANAVELVRLHQLFQENDVQVLPLKGSVLALQIYGNLALRHAGDIDLLVNLHQVAQADRLLQEDYCRVVPNYNLTPYQQDQFYRHMHHFNYFHCHKNISVELHWRPSYYHQDHINFIWFSNPARYVSVAHFQLPALSPEDLILYLCVHGANHFWSRLFWLLDLAEIVRQAQGTDWEQVIVMAQEFGIIRTLIQGVILSYMFCDAPLPEPIKSYAALDQGVAHLIRVPCWYISCPQPEKAPIHQLIEDKLYLLRICNKFSDKVGLFHRLALKDCWTSIRLPDTLFQLHYLLRPFLFLYRRWHSGQNNFALHEKVRE